MPERRPSGRGRWQRRARREPARRSPPETGVRQGVHPRSRALPGRPRASAGHHGFRRGRGTAPRRGRLRMFCGFSGRSGTRKERRGRERRGGEGRAPRPGNRARVPPAVCRPGPPRRPPGPAPERDTHRTTGERGRRPPVAERAGRPWRTAGAASHCVGPVRRRLVREGGCRAHHAVHRRLSAQPSTGRREERFPAWPTPSGRSAPRPSGRARTRSRARCPAGPHRRPGTGPARRRGEGPCAGSSRPVRRRRRRRCAAAPSSFRSRAVLARATATGAKRRTRSSPRPSPRTPTVRSRPAGRPRGGDGTAPGPGRSPGTAMPLSRRDTSSGSAIRGETRPGAPAGPPDNTTTTLSSCLVT